LDGGSARRKAATLTQTQNKSTQTYTPRVRFEPTTPVFERAKTVHASDHAATVIGFTALHLSQKLVQYMFAVIRSLNVKIHLTTLQSALQLPTEYY
jgi:hypothetical protein